MKFLRSNISKALFFKIHVDQYLGEGRNLALRGFLTPQIPFFKPMKGWPERAAKYLVNQQVCELKVKQVCAHGDMPTSID